MAKFYFTYGLSEHFPYQDGWTEIQAPDIVTAQKLFSVIHPDRVPGVLNCAWIYSEEGFKDTVMYKNGNFGGFCRERITYTKMKGDMSCMGL